MHRREACTPELAITNAPRAVARAGSRSPGSAQWEDLPEPVQRLVLSRPMLSLRQLAKLATSCKLFEEVFLERYEADLAWLVECATSAFGQGMIGAALRFFSQEWDCLGNEVVRWDQIFDTEGADDSEGYTTAVEAPARGLLGECGGTIARWQFTKLSEDCGSVILITLGGLASFRAEAEGAQLNCYISAEYPCQIIPCLGLLHLLLKQAWDCNVKRATSAPARHREWETILLIDEMDQPKRRLPGDEVSGMYSAPSPPCICGPGAPGALL